MGSCLMGRVSILQDAKNSGGWLHNVNVLNTIDLYTEKWLQ